jgi:hypothetical protein
VFTYVGRPGLVSNMGQIVPELPVSDLSDEEKRRKAPVLVTTESGLHQRHESLHHFVAFMQQNKRITEPIDKRRKDSRRKLERKDTYEVLTPGTSSKSLTKEETEMVTWMGENGLEEFVDLFLEECVDIYTIQYITKETLIEMKITQIGAQMKILKAIEKLSRANNIDKPVFLKGSIDIGSMLGVGVGGAVHKGIWNKTTPVALKSLHTESKDPKNSEIESFKSEAAVLMSLNHPNVLRFLGLYQSPEKKMYIVTEYMEKGSLLDYVKRQTLANDQLFKMAKNICSGMTYLEENKILHRDLSCRNCLVGGGGEVKVADFGLSRILQSDSSYVSVKKVMPYKWCSPESLSKFTWTSKSDVWSFGVVLWEMWSKGEEPYGNKSNKEVSDFVRDGGRLEKPKNCPDKLFDIMKKCWAAEPDKRPSFCDLYVMIEQIETPSANKTEEPARSTQVSIDQYIDE